MSERDFQEDSEDEKDPSEKWIQRNDDGSVTVLLEYPVKRGKDGDEVSEVTLRRMIVADLEASDKAEGDVKKTLMIVSSLTDLPTALLRRIDMDDFERISSVLNKDKKRKKSQATGEE